MFNVLLIFRYLQRTYCLVVISSLYMPSGGKGGKGDSNLLKSNNALLLEIGIESQGLSPYSYHLLQ